MQEPAISLTMWIVTSLFFFESRERQLLFPKWTTLVSMAK
jgi:hypothetical protein